MFNTPYSTLHRTAILHPNKHLFIIKDHDLQQEPSKTESGRPISYSSARKYCLLHQQYLEHVVEQWQLKLAVATFPSNLNKSRKIGGCDGEMIIYCAYLSQNTPNFILSVLACMELNNHSATTIDGRHAPSCIRYIPVMLNTRWSSSEIASAVQIENNNNCGSKQSKIDAMTMIIYGNGMESNAKNAAALVSSIENKSGFCHEVITVSIPNMIEAKITDWRRATPLSSNVFKNHPESQLDDKQQSTLIDQQNEIEIISASNHITNVKSSHIESEVAIILFTSGSSSGKPKGVVLSHCALLTQCIAKCGHPCNYSEKTCIHLNSSPPFYHVGGLSSVLTILMSGGTFICDRSGASGFSPARLINRIREDRVNTLVVVPAMLHSMIHHLHHYTDKQEMMKQTIKHAVPAAPKYPQVKLILVGGQALALSMMRECTSIFSNARIIQTYACTEAGSSMTFRELFPSPTTPAFSYRSSNEVKQEQQIGGDCVGIPPPMIEIRISCSDNTTSFTETKSSFTRNPFLVGTICTRGPHIMNRYWERCGNNFAKLSQMRSQWLETNDLGYLDPQNRLYFCGRKTDVIRTGGETVFAPEVERAIMALSSLSGLALPFGECAVFPFPDERLGETVCVAVVLLPSNNNKKELTISGKIKNTNSFLFKRLEEVWNENIRNGTISLAGYKRPRKLFMIPSLPKNSMGKVLKHDLRRLFVQQSSGSKL